MNDFPGGIVNRGKETGLTAPLFKPMLVGAIKLDEIALGWSALPPSAMLFFFPLYSFGPNIGLNQNALNGFWVVGDTMRLG